MNGLSLSRCAGAIGVLGALVCCGPTHHASSPTVPDAAAVDPDESPATAAIPLEGPTCGGGRWAMVALSVRKVFVTNSCAFYAVDTIDNKVVKLREQGQALDSDGRTVAVIADKLGLSHDGGETFDWTDWQLVRCQGSPLVRAGADFAVVGCIGGLGTWHGVGTAFASFSPSGASLISPDFVAGGARFIATTVHGWWESSDGGSSSHAFQVEGLPAGAQTSQMEIGGEKLWVLAPGDDSPNPPTALFAAPLGSGTFTRVSALPSDSRANTLRYNDGVLVVAGARIYLSADQGASFTEPTLQPVPSPGIPDAPITYSAGHVFRVNEGTLYVDAVRL